MDKQVLLIFVEDRVRTINFIMDNCFHVDADSHVAMGARDLIYDTLKEIEEVHHYIADDIDDVTLDTIARAQDLFMKRLYV